MGSSLSQKMCCVICVRCREHEAEGACEEISETKPILQVSGEPPVFTDTQSPTPALKVPRPGSKVVQSLGQAQRPSAATLEENTETCSATDPTGRAEGWESAWNPLDFYVAPADEEIAVEVTDLTQAEDQQEEVGHLEEKMKAVPCVPEAQPVGDTARGAELVAAEEQPHEQAEPGSQGALCAGITILETNILNLIEFGSETAPGQGCEAQPPADTGEVSSGKELSVCAGQVAEKTEPYLPAGTQCGVPSAQGMESQPCAEPAWFRELLHQSSQLCELEDEGSRECDAGEAELQHRIVQQTAELPEEPETCISMPVKQEAEFPDVPLLLSEVFGSSEEIKDESVAA